MRRRFAFVLVFILSVEACSHSLTACAPEGNAAVIVTVLDSVTRQRVANDSVTVTDQSGLYRFTHIVGLDTTVYPLVFDGNATTYSVAIRAVGFELWNTTLTVAGSGTCQTPNAAVVQALLQRSN